MTKKTIWAPFWIAMLILYGVLFLVSLPFTVLSMLGEEANEGYRD